MTDPEIPQTLLDLQRRFDAAYVAVRAASAVPGPVTEWTPEQRDALVQARAEELAALEALNDAAEGTPFAAWPERERMRKAARGGAAG